VAADGVGSMAAEAAAAAVATCSAAPVGVTMLQSRMVEAVVGRRVDGQRVSV
jgi:hypothetical protein